MRKKVKPVFLKKYFVCADLCKPVCHSACADVKALTAA